MVERPTLPEPPKLPAAVAEWRESIRTLREATAAAVGEIAALRREAATVTRQLRSEGGDGPSPEGAALDRIAARLQFVEHDLEQRARLLRDHEGQALSSIRAILEQTAQDLRRVRAEPPRPAADPEALRAVQSGVAALRHGLEAVGERLGALERGLPRQVTEASGPLRADVARAMQEMRDQAEGLYQALNGEQRAELLGGLEATASDLRQQIASVTEGLSAAQRAVEERAEALPQRLERSVAGLADRMVAALDERIGALEARVAEDVAARGSDRREREEHQKRLETAMIVLKDEVMLMASSLRDEVAGPMRDLATDRNGLRRGLERVDRLAEIVESLGRRRGFRELVEAERALHAEQAAFVDRLNAAGEGLTAMAHGVERRLQAMVEETAQRIRPDPLHIEALAGAEASMATLRQDLSAAMANLQQDLPAAMADLVIRVEATIAEMQERIEALSGTAEARKDEGGQQDQAAVRVQRELRSATTALKRQVEGLTKRIEGWGKPRTAPRLAQEVRDLGRRFEALEQEVQSEVAAKVARRVQASVDRRLRALVGELSEEIRQMAREAAVETAQEAVPQAASEPGPAAVVSEPGPEVASEPGPEVASEPQAREPTPRFAPEPGRRGRFRRPRR